MKSKIKKILSLVVILFIAFSLFACEDENVIKEITTEYTDSLKLASSYGSKSFLKDGIGKVTLTQNVDGDTAHFRDSTGEKFTARFLMINTPESTGRVDAWGKKASAFTASKLDNAVEIVLESEVIGTGAELDTTRARYLAYVWYKPSETTDFRLLNLEIVEECYSTFVNNEGDGKYGETFAKANEKCLKLAMRVYGEKDPDFDYSYSVNEISILYLRDHFEEYCNGSKLKMTVRLVRINGDNVYVEDVDQTFDEETKQYNTAGIYMFSGYTISFAKVKLGSVFTMQCQCVKNDIYGYQLTNPISGTLKIISKPVEGVELINRKFDGKTNIDLPKLEGYVIQIDNVKVIGKYNEVGENGEYTINCETESGQRINIRIDKSTTPKYPFDNVKIGSFYRLIGGVSQYSDTYQIMLCNQQNEGLNDFVLMSTLQEQN